MGQKNPQPLGKKKNHATSRDQKNSSNLSGQKNHATYQDERKKYETSLVKNKLRNLLRQKKITQPLGTQKKS